MQSEEVFAPEKDVRANLVSKFQRRNVGEFDSGLSPLTKQLTQVAENVSCVETS